MWNLVNSVVGWLRSFWVYHLHVVVLGPANAGKSTIVRRLAGGSFDDDKGSTRGFDLLTIRKENATIRCWDVGGQAGYQNQWPEFIKEAQIVIFVIDSSDPKSLQESKSKLQELFQKPGSLDRKRLFILANKSDIKGSITISSDFDGQDEKSGHETEMDLPISLDYIKSRIRIASPKGSHSLSSVRWTQTSAKENENIGELEHWLQQAVMELSTTQ